jgi:hypothetical protein
VREEGSLSGKVPRLSALICEIFMHFVKMRVRNNTKDLVITLHLRLKLLSSKNCRTASKTQGPSRKGKALAESLNDERELNDRTESIAYLSITCFKK